MEWIFAAYSSWHHLVHRKTRPLAATVYAFHHMLTTSSIINLWCTILQTHWSHTTCQNQYITLYIAWKFQTKEKRDAWARKRKQQCIHIPITGMHMISREVQQGFKKPGCIIYSIHTWPSHTYAGIHKSATKISVSNIWSYTHMLNTESTIHHTCATKDE